VRIRGVASRKFNPGDPANQKGRQTGPWYDYDEDGR
jgi:hypothetical protein